ncbi:uncharacterized protein LOC144478214, partial [Augochlora pura]
MVFLPSGNIELCCDVSTSALRPFVTREFLEHVWASLHNLAHPGAKATAKLVAQRFVWPGMQKDCKSWARACLPCQRAKTGRHVSAPVGTFRIPSERFEHIHVDIVGPLPMSKGYRYCVTCVDRYPRWPEAFPVENITAETVAYTLLAGWIARYGAPHRITTDQGRQFESALFKQLSHLTGTKHLRTTAYHSAANGMVERFHRQLKAAIVCHADSWADALPVVLLGIRAAWKEDIQATSAKMVYGEPIRLPGELLIDRRTANVNDETFIAKLREHFRRLRPTSVTRHGSRKTFVFKDLHTTTQVFVRHGPPKRALQPAYDGPYEVVERHPKYFNIRIKERVIPVSLDRLKPAYLLHDDEQ